MKAKPAALYLFLLAAIFGWWMAAFRSHGTNESVPIQLDLKPNLDPSLFPSPFASLDRDEIQRALCGELPLMIKLIADWDLDAEILDSYGLIGIKRLPKEALLRAKLLGRIFSETTKEELLSLQNSYRLKGIIDDKGAFISLSEPFHLFLPQTFVAASCLLSLSDPSQIVAIPKGIREQTELFPPKLTNQIQYDIDRYNGEHFFQVKPQIAFVSHYSHPSTLEALHNQGIKLFAINAVDTLSDIRHTLIRIGNVINRPLDAELLTIFMEAAMCAIDNRLMAMKERFSPQRLLYLNYHTQYSSPSSKTLTWQLLDRLNVTHCLPKTLVDAHAHDWSIPLDQEQIVHYNPDFLIIASSSQETVPALHSLSARVAFVDDNIQQSPSQFIVLAYYDLAQALCHQELNHISLSKFQILTTNQP